MVAIVSGTVTACKKDHDKPATEQPGPIKRLAEINNGEDFIRFAYNPDSTVKKVTTTLLADSGASVAYNVSYANGKIQELNGDDGMKIVPVYDEGLLIRAHFYMGEERVAYANYTVMNDSERDIAYYVKDGDDYLPMLSIRVTYDAKDNPVESVLMVATDEPNLLRRDSHIEYSYDEKPNPLYAQKDLLALFFQSISKNNTLEEDHFDKDLVPENRYRYTYTYEANGQPRQAAVKIGLDGQPVTNKQVHYTYDHP